MTLNGICRDRVEFTFLANAKYRLSFEDWQDLFPLFVPADLLDYIETISFEHAYVQGCVLVLMQDLNNEETSTWVTAENTCNFVEGLWKILDFNFLLLYLFQIDHPTLSTFKSKQLHDIACALANHFKLVLLNATHIFDWNKVGLEQQAASLEQTGLVCVIQLCWVGEFGLPLLSDGDGAVSLKNNLTNDPHLDFLSSDTSPYDQIVFDWELSDD